VSRARGGWARVVALVFFALLALQLVLRYARPEPAPAWSRVAVIACCAGIIACLVIQFFSERPDPTDDGPAPGPPGERE
jgi:hypothetical protein